MRLNTPSADQTIDLSGKRCPHLVIAILGALSTMERNQILQVIATDPVAPSSIAAWARQSGHTLLDMYEEKGHFVFYLQRAPVFVHRPAESRGLP